MRREPWRPFCYFMLYCRENWGVKKWSYFSKMFKKYVEYNPLRDTLASSWDWKARPCKKGFFFFFPFQCLWLKHTDIWIQDLIPGYHYLFNWKKTQGSFACLNGSYSLLEGKELWEMLHSLASPEIRSKRVIFSGPACFWLVWQALVSYQMWKFFSAWDNLFICLCILPGKYLLSSWYSFARSSWGNSSSV